MADGWLVYEPPPPFEPVDRFEPVILHVVTFRWHQTVTTEDVEALSSDLRAFRQTAGALLVDYHFGPDLELRHGNGDFAVVALLASPGDLAAYLDHPLHKELVARRLGPMTETRLAVQIEVEPAPIA
ncbi:MAG: Dabb family protein [Acidimicrobiales bacterium]|jgi:hypothetical protein